MDYLCSICIAERATQRNGFSSVFLFSMSFKDFLSPAKANYMAEEMEGYGVRVMESSRHSSIYISTTPPM